MNSINDEGSLIIQNALMKYEKLVNLDLSKCKITSTGATQIAKCLKNK